MKEYTILAVASVILTVIFDRASGVKVLSRPYYYVFLLIVAGFKFLVNGYLTGRQIVIYDPRFYLGIRLGTIPVEDFLFGFSMVTTAVIVWEWSKARQRSRTTG